MIKKISHYGIATFYNALIGIFSIFILTKFYSLEDFGKIALFILIGNVLGNLLTLGLGKATQRFYFESLKDKNDLAFMVLNFTNITTIFLIFILSFPIFYILNNNFNSFFKINETFDFLILAFIYGFFNTFYFYFLNLIISQKKSKKYLLFAISYATLNFIFTIILIFIYSDDYLSRIYSLLFVNILFSILILFSNLKYLVLNYSKQLVIKSFKFCLPGYPSTLVGVFHSNFDKSFLASIKSLNSLGLLDISNRIGLISKMFIDFVIQAWIPEFMTNANENKKNEIVKNYNQIIFFFGIFIISLSYFSQEILWILTTEEFYIAKNYIPLICFGVFINHLFTLIASPSITFAKKLQKHNIPSIVSLALNVILNILLVPVYDVLGVLISMIISGFVSGILLFLNSQKLYKIDISLKLILIKILIMFVFISMLYLLYILKLNYIYILLIKMFLLILFIKLSYSRELDLEDIFYKIKNNLLTKN